MEPDRRRIVITGYAALQTRLLLARFNPETGALALDSSFKAPGAREPGVSFRRSNVAARSGGTAIPHGAVFSRPTESP